MGQFFCNHDLISLRKETAVSAFFITTVHSEDGFAAIVRP
jgi:hypothetical protein